MKRFLNWVKASLDSQISFLENYFLDLQAISKDRPLRARFDLQLLSNDTEGDLAQIVEKDMKNREIADIFVFISSDLDTIKLDYERLAKNFPKSRYLLVRPCSLEKISLIIKNLSKYDLGVIKILIKGFAKIPFEVDVLPFNITSDKKKSHLKAIIEFINELRDISNQEQINIIALEYKELLGQKNNALLRRVFFNNSIYLNK